MQSRAILSVGFLLLGLVFANVVPMRLSEKADVRVVAQAAGAPGLPANQPMLKSAAYAIGALLLTFEININESFIDMTVLVGNSTLPPCTNPVAYVPTDFTPDEGDSYFTIQFVYAFSGNEDNCNWMGPTTVGSNTVWKNQVVVQTRSTGETLYNEAVTFVEEDGFHIEIGFPNSVTGTLTTLQTVAPISPEAALLETSFDSTDAQGFITFATDVPYPYTIASMSVSFLGAGTDIAVIGTNSDDANPYYTCDEQGEGEASPTCLQVYETVLAVNYPAVCQFTGNYNATFTYGCRTGADVSTCLQAGQSGWIELYITTTGFCTSVVETATAAITVTAYETTLAGASTNTVATAVLLGGELFISTEVDSDGLAIADYALNEVIVYSGTGTTGTKRYVFSADGAGSVVTNVNNAASPVTFYLTFTSQYFTIAEPITISVTIGLTYESGDAPKPAKRTTQTVNVAAYTAVQIVSDSAVLNTAAPTPSPSSDDVAADTKPTSSASATAFSAVLAAALVLACLF